MTKLKAKPKPEKKIYTRDSREDNRKAKLKSGTAAASFYDEEAEQEEEIEEQPKTRGRQAGRDVATTRSAVPSVTTTPNAWESYGAVVGSRQFVGELLKFSKGDYTVGREGTELEPGTELVAVMDSLVVGWTKWRDGMPVDERVGLVQTFQPPQRAELGDNDADLWERDDDDKPRDPWQFGNRLVMVGVEDQAVFTFTTSSRGGLSAVGELAKAYGRRLHAHPDEYPVVELGVSSYQHRVKSYGRIKVPVLRIASWTDAGRYRSLIDSRGNDD